MGSWLSCMEKGSWDHAHHVRSKYKPHEHGRHQDMSQTLSHYFISSGHNSYLQGNQLTSTAGTQTIEVGLRHGCRVVELDVYDGPTEPEVTHGGTLTSTVTFRDCVKAVSRHAFHASPYPVILTIENHVKQQQDQLVKILKEVLGHHLFVPEAGQLAREGQWLSPEALKHKVVVRMKVKPGSTDPALAALVYICNTSITTYDVAAGRAEPSSHSLPDSKLPQVPEYADYSLASKLFSFRTPQAAQAQQAAQAGGDPEEIAKQYAAATKAAGRGSAGHSQAAAAAGPDAVHVSKGTRDQDFTDRTAAAAAGAGAGAGGASQDAQAAAGGSSSGNSAAPAGPPKLRSFRLSYEDVVQEEALEEDLDDTVASPSSMIVAPDGSTVAPDGNVTKPDLAAVLSYTSKHLMRCYPSAWRMLDNSNPNPAGAWSYGISLAALNWQLWDQALWVNEAFFSQQKHTGYVLKPDWMRQVNPQQAVPDREARTLNVHVFSAHRPQGKRVGVFKDDMYVELRIVGMPHDAATQSSPHKNNTGRLIVDRDFSFPVKFPELGVLLVLLKDQDSVMSDTILGYTGIPLANLAPGAYQLPLAEPKVMGGETHHTGMWVKLQVGWEDAAAAHTAAADQAAAGTQQQQEAVPKPAATAAAAPAAAAAQV